MNQHVKLTRAGRYMHTFMGTKYWPFDPRTDEIHIVTIAHHLAMRCRWNGATTKFYSVAEHSVHVSRFCDPEDALEGLLHDGSEAYNGDLIRPLKYSPEFAQPFKKVETLNERVIAIKFGLQYPWPASVKVADEMLATTEDRQLIVKAPGEDWESGKLHDDSVAADLILPCWSPEEAKSQFMARFWEIMERR